MRDAGGGGRLLSLRRLGEAAYISQHLLQYGHLFTGAGGLAIHRGDILAIGQPLGVERAHHAIAIKRHAEDLPFHRDGLEEGLPGSLAPGKRPRTTLTPTLAHRDGEPYMVWGSPGGDQQDQWITQMFLRHVHCGMNLQEAIDAPAWHSEHFPSSFWPRQSRPGVLVLEGRIPKETAAELKKRGHEVEMNDDWSEGRLTAASRQDPWRKAAANPRGMQGYAAGR